MNRLPNLSIIVAVTANNAIGRNGNLLFHLREDLKFFRKTTMGHPVIMGRKTWQSLPGGALPGRRNIVISRNPDFNAPGAEVVDSLHKAMSLVADSPEAFVIGGAQIYAEALPFASRLYLTMIDRIVDDADTYFPVIDLDDWDNITPDAQVLTDPTNGISFRFVCLSHK